MPNDRSLNAKLLITFLAVCLYLFTTVNTNSLNDYSLAISNQSFLQLEAVPDIKKIQIENLFTGRIRTAWVLEVNPFVHNALQELHVVFNEKGVDGNGFS